MPRAVILPLIGAIGVAILLVALLVYNAYEAGWQNGWDAHRANRGEASIEAPPTISDNKGNDVRLAPSDRTFAARRISPSSTPPGYVGRYYITGGTEQLPDGSKRQRDQQGWPIVVDLASSRLDAITRAGFTVWPEPEWTEAGLWKITEQIHAAAADASRSTR